MVAREWVASPNTPGLGGEEGDLGPAATGATPAPSPSPSSASSPSSHKGTAFLGGGVGVDGAPSGAGLGTAPVLDRPLPLPLPPLAPGKACLGAGLGLDTGVGASWDRGGARCRSSYSRGPANATPATHAHIHREKLGSWVGGRTKRDGTFTHTHTQRPNPSPNPLPKQRMHTPVASKHCPLIAA
jgi:hypothetical protein